MQQFGEYMLTSLLGRGGMAEVHRARRFGPAGFERQLVVKRILGNYNNDPSFVHMFVNEAKVAAQLNHPNVVHIFDFGEVNGEYFIAMEYIKGKDLLWMLRFLQKHTPERSWLPPSVAAFVIAEVCRGLGHAHAQTDGEGNPRPIVHRDVSPQNVMIAYDGQVKLVDFGIAKALASAQTEESVGGAFKGKFAYSAPEQATGAVPGPESDIFSAGIVLYEILTGRRLFKADNDVETIRRVCAMPIVPPSHFVSTIPPALDRIVLRALERDRGRRYPRAVLMARDLDDYLRSVHFSAEQMADWMEATVPASERQADNDAPAVGQAVPPEISRPSYSPSRRGAPTPGAGSAPAVTVTAPAKTPLAPKRLATLAAVVALVAGGAGAAIMWAARPSEPVPAPPRPAAPAVVAPVAPPAAPPVPPVAEPEEAPPEEPRAARPASARPAATSKKRARENAGRTRARIEAFGEEDAPPPKIEAFE